jgi:hypothetical protein
VPPPPMVLVLNAEEIKGNQDPSRMFSNDNARIKPYN